VPEPVVSLLQVSKRYPRFVLDPFDLEVGPNRLVGLVGPNGSGKSTLLRILVGLVRPDSGQVRICGHPVPQRQADAKQEIGFVSEDMRLHAGATLRWHARLVRSLCPAWDENRANNLAERLGLSWDQRAGSLSRGQTAKAMLLLALARRPRLLLLDEATAALDSEAREDVLGELGRLVSREGVTVLLSSHHAADLAGRADEVFQLPEGRWEAFAPSPIRSAVSLR